MGVAFKEKSPPLIFLGDYPKKKGRMIMLDFRMNTFLTVCRCMNFTRASEELHITQPAVSQHIRYLEKYYGQKLFYYEGKRLGLTAAGEMLRNTSLNMLNDELSLQSRMQKETDMPEELCFGVTCVLGDDWVTEALRQFLLKEEKTDRKKRYLKLITADTEELLERLEKNEIAFALVESGEQTARYESCPYITEKLLAVCSPDYRFAKKAVTLKELREERIFIGESGSAMRKAVEELLGVSDLKVEDFSKVAEIGSFHTMKELTKAGCGITFLYEAAIWEELNCGRLREIKLKDFQVSREFTFVWKMGSSSGQKYRELFAQFRK